MSDQDFRDMTYWKATQPDGTDFHTGTVDYAAALASGEPLPELSGDGGFPGPGWYHLATVPTECVGMSWPSAVRSRAGRGRAHGQRTPAQDRGHGCAGAARD